MSGKDSEQSAFDAVLAGRLSAIRERLKLVCSRAGRSEASVSIVAVTKTFPHQTVRKACALGLTEIGENRVQEVVEKFSDGSILREYPGVRLHLVGHLQTNKVRKAVQYASCIDSVDSMKLADLINHEAGLIGKRLRLLIEVNTSGEPQKHGLNTNQVINCAEYIMNLHHLELAGLMTVGPNVDDPLIIRQSFAELRKLFENVRQGLNPPHWSVFSMGMSGDWEIAVEEGATEIRLGTALFGERSPV